MRTSAQIKKAIAASYKAAMRLDTLGMPVIVTRDSGQEEHSKLTQLPWTLGHGAWVAVVEGIRGGYDCARIRPGPQASGNPPKGATTSADGEDMRTLFTAASTLGVRFDRGGA